MSSINAPAQVEPLSTSSTGGSKLGFLSRRDLASLSYLLSVWPSACVASNGNESVLVNVELWTGCDVRCKGQNLVDACAGAVSGIGLEDQQPGTSSLKKAERAHRADVHSIPFAGSYSVCMASFTSWRPGKERNDIVWWLLIRITYTAITTRGAEGRKFLGHACCL
jgi:hypothetical protein